MIFRSGEGEAAVHARYRKLLADWPVPSEQRLLDTREGPTFVVSSGPADAPPLVLLHGSGGTTLDWYADIATWSDHFRVHAIDLIGEPGLSAPSRPQLGSDDYASWLDDVLAGLGVDRFSMAAVSLGGWFALLVHRHFNPRRVKLPLFTDGQLDKLDLLVIVGGRDRMLDSHETQRRLPDRTVLLPEAGHILPQQTQRILDYLKADR